MLKPYYSSRNLRSSIQILLVVPRFRLKTKGDCAFEVVAPKLWNALPLKLRSVVSMDIFKKKLKMHLFELAFVYSVLLIVMSIFNLFVYNFDVKHCVTLALERCYRNKHYLFKFVMLKIFHILSILQFNWVNVKL